MTLENCKRLLEHYDKCRKDNSLSEQARLNSKGAYEDMHAHIAKKYNDVPVVEEKPKGKKDGKK